MKPYVCMDVYVCAQCDIHIQGHALLWSFSLSYPLQLCVFGFTYPLLLGPLQLFLTLRVGDGSLQASAISYHPHYCKDDYTLKHNKTQ